MRRHRIAARGPAAVLLSVAALACGPSGKGGVEQPAADPVIATGAEVAASRASTTAEPIAPAVEVEVAPAPPPEPPPPAELAGAALRRRYGLANAKQTLTGDRGAGYDDLYGTRNVRAVLNGVFYRGGANNAFHRDGKRGNKNPLPDDGLANLCKQGFSTAVYLYPTNFETAAKETACQTADGGQGTLVYEQITSQHYKKADLKLLFGMIMASLRQPGHGPVYAHCWNGWHASGYVAAIALRQFCGFTGPQALRYWSVTAKGASNADHDDTKERIGKFKPFPEFELTAEEKAAVCPDPKSLAFPAPEPAP